MSFRPWSGSACILALLSFAPPAAAAAAHFATYRAVHDLILDEASAGATGGGVVSARMVTEFTGSACAGYTTKTRFVTDGADADGNELVTDQRTTTLETSDGRFEFTNQTWDGDQQTEESVGVAKRGAGTITVKLDKPTQSTFTLDPAIAFPTEQTERVLDAARDGKRFVAFDVYDGSEDGTSVLATAAVIGAPLTAADDGPDAAKMAAAGYVGVRHWPVTVSYFDKSNGADATPFFVLSSVLYENGILTDLRMDYGKFSLNGTLTEIEPLAAAPCPG